MNVASFGALGNGVTDDTAAFVSAIAAVPPTGATIEIDPGVFPISSTLVITTPNTRFVGAGGSSWSNSTWQPATTIKWAAPSSATMIHFAPIWGPSVPGLHRPGVERLLLDGNGIASTALKLRSVKFGSFRDLTIINPITYGIYLGVVPYATATPDPRDSQNCTFDNIAIRTAETTGTCLYLDGDAQIANSSYNVFRNMMLYANSHPEIIIVNGDNNVFYDVRCFHAGTGKSVVLDGTNPGYVMFNSFYHLTPLGGLEQKGAYATKNACYEYDMSQGGVPPTITSGVLTWTGISSAAMRYAAPVFGLGGASGSGFRADNTDPTATAGLDLYDAGAAFVANLAYRGLSNGLFPDTVALTVGNKDVVIGTNYAQRVMVPKQGGLVMAGPLSLTSTDGFLYLPTCAGTPTGTPTARAGSVPLVYDTVAHRFWVYDGGVWR